MAGLPFKLAAKVAETPVFSIITPKKRAAIACAVNNLFKGMEIWRLILRHLNLNDEFQP